MSQDWDSLGKDIRNIVQGAIDSQDFRKLNQTINSTINEAITGVQKGLNEAEKAVNSAVTETKQQVKRDVKIVEQKKLFAKKTSVKIGGMTLVICGATIAAALGLSIFIVLLVAAITGSVPGATIAIGIMTPLFLGSLLMAVKGGSMLGRVKRFRNYVQELGGRTYCNIQELAKSSGKSNKYVLRDVKFMIQKGWFLEGHLDRQETCLIVSHETFREYAQLQKQAEEQKRIEAEQAVKAMQPAAKTEVQKIIAEGNDFIQKIHESNDAISGIEISEKISRMETLVKRIFERVEQNPDAIPEIHKLMTYYLPTTVKLLDAYEDLDRQPIQGENIISSKKEIEQTLDTLNLAFEKLLDSLFEDIAWDVSSDISVLHTILAQEGLTKKDF